ncbi:Hypothetical protein FKW44_012957 [Caligus rogercresseyi]|uniref:Uncharacterized protein n=1 Tax=Caligus rogercresseyi TaxID=217165 RepID=A0A7T8KB42_CALRO|nr:Hypothetical protein FKW44_012957 [Caligus rogercresseyi]
MPRYWFPKGLRVVAKVTWSYAGHCKALDGCKYPDGNYCWQQDGAPGTKLKLCNSGVRRI